MHFPAVAVQLVPVKYWQPRFPQGCVFEAGRWRSITAHAARALGSVGEHLRALRGAPSSVIEREIKSDNDVESVAWSPNGKLLAVVASDKTAAIFDVASGTSEFVERGSTGTNLDPGHEEEIFKPQLVASRMPSGEKPPGTVFNRLAEQGRHSIIDKQNDHATLLNCTITAPQSNRETE